MSNIFEVKKEQLKDKFAEIVPWDYVGKANEYVFTVYIGGILPIRIKSKLTYEQFCKIC